MTSLEANPHPHIVVLQQQVCSCFHKMYLAAAHLKRRLNHSIGILHKYVSVKTSKWGVLAGCCQACLLFQKLCQSDTQHVMEMHWCGVSQSCSRDYSQASAISPEQEEDDMTPGMLWKQHVGEKHGTNISQTGYLQVVSVGVIGSSADWGGGRI